MRLPSPLPLAVRALRGCSGSSAGRFCSFTRSASSSTSPSGSGSPHRLQPQQQSQSTPPPLHPPSSPVSAFSPLLPSSSHSVQPPPGLPFGFPLSAPPSSSSFRFDDAEGRSPFAPPPPSDLTTSISDRLARYARLPHRGVTLSQLLSVGERPSPLSLLASAQFLHQELPIRLAKRVMDLEALPYGLSQTSSVQVVAGWYRESFRDITSVQEPRSSAEELRFTLALERIYERHHGVVSMMAAGVLQMKRRLASSSSSMLHIADQCPFLFEFLNRFFYSRMGIRLLISQHVQLHHPRPGYIGTIALQGRPVDIVREAVVDATRACERELPFTPAVSIAGDEQCTFAFLPSHLHHIVFELLKNSMRAVAERFAGREDAAQPISIVLSHDAETFAVRLSDQGGGVAMRDLDKLWSFLYTTKEHGENLTELIERGQEERMAGWGHGLPLSRLHARFLGGDLKLLSMPNHGVDCFLYINKVASTTQLFLD